MDSIVDVKQLSKTYGKRISAVKDISFQVEGGEIFGFLGPNGAGKSTTIMMLATLIKPTSGSGTVAGFDLSTDPVQVRLSLGYVSQDLAVDDTLTGRENLMLQASFYRIASKEAARRTDALLQLVDLRERANDQVETYSGGMRKRLDIATGLIHRPKVLLLDEPTLGLDIQTRRQIWDYVNRLREEDGMTVFLSTHYMDEAEALCERVAIIDQGTIKVLDSPASLKGRIGGDIVQIILEEDAAEQISLLVGALRGVPGVETVKPHPGGCIAVVREGDGAIPFILKATIDCGIEVKALTLKRPSLDDVFLAFTGKELRDTVGTKGDAIRFRQIMRRTRA